MVETGLAGSVPVAAPDKRSTDLSCMGEYNHPIIPYQVQTSMNQPSTTQS